MSYGKSIRLGVLCVFLLAAAGTTADCLAASRLPRPGQSAWITERILDFAVTAIMDADGSMEVTEKITVNAGLRDIRRGIVRDIPLQWNRADGKRFIQQLDVLRVLRNGRPEPFVVSRTLAKVEIRIGDAGRMLSQGPHQYAITYRVHNHFSRFPDWDELYWNVTGHEWAFRIDRASFTLLYRESPGAEPRPLPLRSVDFYTGRKGEKGQWAVSQGNMVRTTAHLSKGEGLTVAYTWPREVLASAPDPVHYSLLRMIFLPSPKTLWLWLFPVAILGRAVWVRRTRYHDEPVVIPLFAVPEGMQPGKLRIVVREGYDDTAFAADVMTLAYKNGLKIEAQGEAMTLLQTNFRDHPQRRPALSDTETRAREALFANGEGLLLDPQNHGRIQAAREIMEEDCTREKGALFYPVTETIFGLWCLTLPMHALVASFFPGLGRGVFILAAFSLAIVLLSFISGGRRSVLFTMVVQPLLAVIALLVLFAMVFGEDLAYAMQAVKALAFVDGYVGSVLLCLAALLYGLRKLPRRTREGARRWALAQGLAMYLGTAERERYAEMYPPEESVEHFEQLLPYALALDKGRTWADRFAEYLARTKDSNTLPDIVQWPEVDAFRFALSTSSRAPRAESSDSGGDSGGSSWSGSGSSGGGFSGGGSGGGGGRGW